MIRVRLTLEPDGAVCLESPYDRTFVDGLKLAIDYGGRQWDPQRKKWLVSALYVDVLEDFLQRVGAQVQDDRGAPPAGSGAVVPPPPMPTDLREAFNALFLAYAAPLCVAEASYKALAKYFHPDVGGHVDDFHGVNDAIAIVRKYLNPKPEPMHDDTDIPF